MQDLTPCFWHGRGVLAFNPFDYDTRWNPYPLYAQARAEHPAYRHPDFPITSVFRYADVEAILKDAASWSNQIRVPGVDMSSMGPPSMLGQDAPEHTRLRGLVNQAFTPRIIRRLEPRMREIAETLIARAVEEGETDFVRSVAYPLPVTVIAEIIGVPAADQAQFKTWSDAAVENLGTGLFMPPSQERVDKVARLIHEMGEYFIPLAEQRLADPREDLLTGLVRAEHEGSRLTRDEMVRMLVLILVAGNETTTTLIGDVILELLAHPDQLARLRVQPDLLENAIEETMRYASPVQLDPRRATRDTELHGVRVDKDQLVVCWIGSANHDERVFEEPERFDITRSIKSHLGFGFGPHYCLGANLARLEARIVTDVLLARTKSFDRSTEEQLPLHPSIVFRGVTRLPLRLVAA